MFSWFRVTGRQMSTKTTVFLAVLALGGAAPAADVILPITVDTYIDSKSTNATNNYGMAITVKALVGNTNDGSVCRGLFMLPDEVAGYETGNLAKAEVCFYVFSDLTAGRKITLYPLTRTFVEGSGNGTVPPDGANWGTCDGTNAWILAGGDYDTNYPVVGVIGDDNYFRWDITALLANPSTRNNLLTHGALLQIDEVPVPPSGTPRAPFTSSDGAAAQRPYVKLTLAAQLSFPITADTYLDSRTTNNYGAATTVKTVINSSDGSVCRGLFKLPPEMDLFDPAEISEAKVLFYVWQDNTTNRNVTLYPLTRPFIEGSGALPADGATWETCDGVTPWTVSGGDFDTNYPIVGVKGPILDEGLHDRFFSWDITPLWTNAATRNALLNCGALLQIDEVPPPSSGIPRAPFTSSDDLGYAADFRPRIQFMVAVKRPDVAQTLLKGDSVAMVLSNCTPYVTNRIERSFDLTQPDSWTAVTNIVATGSETNWMESFPSGRTSAFYRVVIDL